MRGTNKSWFAKGMRDAIPIALGYLAVSFTLGIAAKNAGFTPFQAFLVSFTNNASAGEFAGFTLIAAGGGYLEVAILILITNARYLLMSCALSVGLYGMFLAIISPPARKNRILAGVVLISMGASFAFTKLPVVHTLSTGTRTILLTILIAGGAAILFPINEEEDDTKSTESSVLNNNERQASHES